MSTTHALPRAPAPPIPTNLWLLALWSILLLATPVRRTAAGTFTPQFKPTLEVRRAAGPIAIDGQIDDPGWRGAAVADGFAEVDPGDQVRPPVASEAWITYDDDQLYVALIARDDPSTIRVSLRERDNIFRDDYFGVMLDTYGDQSSGYELFVNPLGIQGDLRIESSGREDGAFDMIWESEGRITDAGYQVEIAVPFRSLRFPDRPQQTWRVNFWRDHQRQVRRRYAWAATDRDDPCWMCQWGTLTGIEGIHAGRNLDLIGSLVGAQTGALADRDDPASGFENQHPDADAGFNLRYGITSNAAATLAINPDFSQIESDAGQIDVNTTFALFFPEHRPFFQEGSDLYNTWIDAIYTRSINDPALAGKLTGRFGAASFVYTVARDDNSPMIVPFREHSEFVSAGKSTSNIFRVRRSLRNDSHVGALFTDRRLDGGAAGTVLGGDTALRFLRNYRFALQVVASRTAEPRDTTLSENFSDQTFDGLTTAFDGETFWGHGLYASLDREGRHWSADLSYTAYSPRFRTDNGFTTQNDFRRASAWSGLTLRPNGSWLLDWEPSLAAGRVWNSGGRFEDEWLRPNLFLQLRGQTFLSLQYLRSRERFGERVFDGIRIGSLFLNSRFSEILGGGFSASYGQTIYRDFDAPELGNNLHLSADLTYRPTRQLQIEPSWSYARMDSRRRDAQLFAGYILRTRVNYNFTRQWFLRLILQYDAFSERLDVEPLVTYRINPFTVFYAGTTSSVDHYGPGEDAPLPTSSWKLSRQQFFTKLQYLYQF